MNWTLYKGVIEGERVWRSYKSSDARGVTFRETISFIDHGTGLVKVTAEASAFIAGADVALIWVKESEERKGERLDELFSATCTGGKMYLSITTFADPASGYVKACSASIHVSSTTAIAPVVPAVPATTDDLTEGVTNLYYDTADVDSRADARIGSRILYFDSDASVGGPATEALVVTGLLATDTILSVTQKTPGVANATLLGWSNQIDDGITVTFSADSLGLAVVRVAVLR